MIVPITAPPTATAALTPTRKAMEGLPSVAVRGAEFHQEQYTQNECDQRK